MTVFRTPMLGCRQATALARANGRTASDILEHAVDTANPPPGSSPSAPGASTPDGTTATSAGRPWARPAPSTSWHAHAGAGVDTALPAAVAELFRRGRAAGGAADSFSGLVDRMGKPAWAPAARAPAPRARAARAPATPDAVSSQWGDVRHGRSGKTLAKPHSAPEVPCRTAARLAPAFRVTPHPGRHSSWRP
ncbi:imine reductase family protein [Streptomyces globosus]|uniref:imine reductase family protein n=1 Tax=Streptomyces globosus TaxID=68209 RepID=UPI0038064210